MRGIQNAGNTCYQNSVVQMLMSVESGDSFPRLYHKYKKPSKDPLSFKDISFLSDGTMFADTSIQQDAHEFLLHILNEKMDAADFKMKGYRELCCNKGGRRFVKFSDLMLSLPVQKTLQGAIHNYFHPEDIEGYKWRENGAPVTVNSKISIARWPPRLLVH